MEWNEHLESQYVKYASGKWDRNWNKTLFQFPWRDRAGWLEARQMWQKSRDVGNRFRDGMSAIRGHTHERGWQKEAHFLAGPGESRFHDVRNDDKKLAIEYKSGAVGPKSLQQLAKDAKYLERGGTVEWMLVDGAPVDKAVAAKIRTLQKRFPGQMLVRKVTREQLRMALTVAKHQQKAREREERQQKKVAREKAAQLRKERTPRELAARKTELARVVEANVQAITRAHKEGKVFPAQELNGVYKSIRAEQRKLETMGRNVARDLVADLRLGEKRSREMQAYLTERRAQEPVVRGIQEIGAEARERTAAEKADAEKAQARDLAYQAALERAKAAREALNISDNLAHALEVNDAGHVPPSQQVPVTRAELERVYRGRGGREIGPRGLSRER